ncbi:substrate-binding domain-containing protein [Amylibacter sp. IMCC11727]|uniref:LacI family DNA-binding transcriptional regulator n=1 Tax=Amylibacter sp. IMCC11727 TaxID=3039851 RepID=UPI00244E3A8F|nr:substrate-binding domain-containing protein [Amylibacter sp. IMCC11727]WGI22411.1 substrate-binding domain-containing protein [Amylibacter sp. IMCC11727]
MAGKQSGKVDIVAVAKAAKVSASTVSRTFNHPDLVNPATRKKIDRTIRRLGYIRNRAAQAMHGKRSSTVGLVVPTIDHAIFAELVQSFSETLEAAGFTILMTSHGYDLEREYAVVRKLLEHRVDGVALIGLEHSDETYRLLEQQELPTLAVWNFDKASRVSCVGAENMLAGRMAAEHLLELGHRDIGAVFPNTQGNDRSFDRLRGAKAALSEAGITVPENRQWTTPYSVAQAKAVCLEILAKTDRPSALLCGNDVIAQGCLYAAAQRGLRVPQDLSVMGIGDFKGSKDIEPALSTVRLPAQTIGERAAKLIVRLIAGEKTEITREAFPPKLMERVSTRRLETTGVR